MSDAEPAPPPALQDIRTRLSGPIRDGGFLRRSLLFAELSLVAYMPEALAKELAATMGLDSTAYLDREGAQGCVFSNANDIVVAVRGTEAKEWNDISADVNALADLAETVGRVHRGFRREADRLWPLIRAHLDPTETRDLWFAGHSLGGAIATICAMRCAVAERPIGPVELFTYGSPRIGNRDYVKHASLTHHRWVNNNDIVTRVPPRWLGYTHGDPFHYLDGHGRWNPSLTRTEIARDQSAAFWHELRRKRIDSFADHLIASYMTGIRRALDEHGDIEPGVRGVRRLVPRLSARRKETQATPSPSGESGS